MDEPAAEPVRPLIPLYEAGPMKISRILLCAALATATSGTAFAAYPPEPGATPATATLSVELDGHDNIRTPGVHTFEAMPTGGNGTYSYAWSMERPNASTITGTGKTFSWYFEDCTGPEWYNLEVTVTSGSETAGAGTLLNIEIYCE